MRGKVIICALAAACLLCGCGKDTEETQAAGSFGSEKGTVEGTADFATETPNISLKNITTYIGEEIDYSSGVEIVNTDRYEDFQMWIDASNVDIYTAGTYEAVYRFVYDGSSMEKTIIVSVVKNENAAAEPSGDNNNASGDKNSSGGDANSSGGGNSGGGDANNSGDGNSGGGDGNNSGDGNGNSSGGDANNSGNGNSSGGDGNNSGSGGSVQPTSGSTQPTSGSIQPTSGSVQPTSGGSQPTSGSVQPTSGGSQPTAKPTSGGSSETSSRQIITSSGSEQTKGYTLGYMNIELLSGSMVKIKCTSAKYIVSTRTDKSEIEKKGVKYNVYKLVITYNTGAEQVLETYEEKVSGGK